MRRRLPSLCDLAILSDAIWESRTARKALAVVALIPEIAVICALAAAAWIDDFAGG